MKMKETKKVNIVLHELSIEETGRKKEEMTMASGGEVCLQRKDVVDDRMRSTMSNCYW